MTTGEQLEHRILAILRASMPPRASEPPSDAYLRALVEIAALGTGDALTATASGCFSGPGQEWVMLTDARDKSRGVLWGAGEGRHVADAYAMVLVLRLLPALAAEVVAWRHGKVQDGPGGADEVEIEDSGPLWGPGV